MSTFVMHFYVFLNRGCIFFKSICSLQIFVSFTFTSNLTLDQATFHKAKKILSCCWLFLLYSDCCWSLLSNTPHPLSCSRLLPICCPQRFSLGCTMASSGDPLQLGPQLRPIGAFKCNILLNKIPNFRLQKITSYRQNDFCLHLLPQHLVASYILTKVH